MKNKHSINPSKKHNIEYRAIDTCIYTQIQKAKEIKNEQKNSNYKERYKTRSTA